LPSTSGLAGYPTWCCTRPEPPLGGPRLRLPADSGPPAPVLPPVLPDHLRGSCSARRGGVRLV